MVTFETVRQLALALPDVEEGTWFGTPAFRVRGKSFARLREEGDVLVVKVDIGYQEALIQMQPATYFTTPITRGIPMSWCGSPMWTERRCADSSPRRGD